MNQDYQILKQDLRMLGLKNGPDLYHEPWQMVLQFVERRRA